MLNKLLITIMFISLCFFTGCIGVNGTIIKAVSPSGVMFEYKTDESKSISGLIITKIDDGWEVKIDKSDSTANTVMAEALLNMTETMKGFVK